MSWLGKHVVIEALFHYDDNAISTNGHTFPNSPKPTFLTSFLVMRGNTSFIHVLLLNQLDFTRIKLNRALKFYNMSFLLNMLIKQLRYSADIVLSARPLLKSDLYFLPSKLILVTFRNVVNRSPDILCFWCPRVIPQKVSSLTLTGLLIKFKIVLLNAPGTKSRLKRPCIVGLTLS